MSHIDSFQHSFVGTFGHIPVYHPLEEINGDFVCNSSHLLIGGGSGEHPAIVIKNPTATVAEFLAQKIESIEFPNKYLKPEWLEIIKPHVNRINDDIIEFCDWTVQDYVMFGNNCASASMRHPFDNDEDELGFEHWLIVSIGEFIFFSMPELAPAIMTPLMNYKVSPYQHVGRTSYNNIVIQPPNMPVYANGGNHFFPNKV